MPVIDTDLLDIPDRLRVLRALRGLSKSKLAEVSGVSRSQITRIELGETTELRDSTVDRLAGALNVDPLELLS